MNETQDDRTTGRGRVERHVELPATPSEVWDALTDPASLSEWFGAKVTVDPPAGFERSPDVGAGSRLRFAMPDGSERRATVEEAERETRLAFRWTPLRRDRSGRLEEVPPGCVEFELTPHGDGTVLRVVESAARGRTELLRAIGFGRPAGTAHGVRPRARMLAGV